MVECCRPSHILLTLDISKTCNYNCNMKQDSFSVYTYCCVPTSNEIQTLAIYTYEHAITTE